MTERRTQCWHEADNKTWWTWTKVCGDQDTTFQYHLFSHLKNTYLLKSNIFEKISLFWEKKNRNFSRTFSKPKANKLLYNFCLLSRKNFFVSFSILDTAIRQPCEHIALSSSLQMPSTCVLDICNILATAICSQSAQIAVSSMLQMPTYAWHLWKYLTQHYVHIVNRLLCQICYTRRAHVCSVVVQ